MTDETKEHKQDELTDSSTDSSTNVSTNSGILDYQEHDSNTTDPYTLYTDSNRVEDSFTATVVEPDDVDDIILEDASMTLIKHDKDNVANMGLSHDEVYKKTKKILKDVYGQLLDGETTITMDMVCYPEWVVHCDINGTHIVFKWDTFGALTSLTKRKTTKNTGNP